MGQAFSRGGSAAGISQPCDEWIDLAAEADAERGVEQGREQGEAGGDGADDRRPGQETDRAGECEDEADELREAQRRHGFAFADRRESRGDELAEDLAVRAALGAEYRSDREDDGL